MAASSASLVPLDADAMLGLMPAPAPPALPTTPTEPTGTRAVIIERISELTEGELIGLLPTIERKVAIALLARSHPPRMGATPSKTWLNRRYYLMGRFIVDPTIENAIVYDEWAHHGPTGDTSETIMQRTMQAAAKRTGRSEARRAAREVAR